MKFLSDLPRNSRNSIKLEPLWSVFGGMILFYAPLYMKGLGVTEVEMGLINTVNLFFAFIFHFLAGPVTNRLGRKRTTLIFDIISWTIPMLIWAVAQNFWYFLIAYSINASVKIVSISWYCLISEDAPENKRAKIFGIMYIINYTTGIFTPVAGLLIAKYGTVPTLRVLYLIGMVSFTCMFIIRNALVNETKAGKEIMEKHSTMSISQSLKSYIVNIAGIRKNKNLILITLILIITNFAASMNFFQILYIKDYLGFSEKALSVTPLISALINLLLFVYVLPKLRNFKDEKLLFIAFLIVCLGILVLLATPLGNMAILLASIGILAVGGFIMQVYRDTVFMNNAGEHDKADMYAAAQTVTTLICIPSGYLGGLMFSLSRQLPFLGMLCLYIIASLIAFKLLRMKGATDEKETDIGTTA